MAYNYNQSQQYSGGYSQQQQDDFSLDDYYGAKKPKVTQKPAAQDDGWSYDDYVNPGKKYAQQQQQQK
jgi:hypothetical protein